MKRWLLGLPVMLALAFAFPSTASAWTRVKNNHNHPVWVSHAFASVSGFLCGWDDGCSGSGAQDWRIQGWWALAAGGETQQIHNSGYGNALHDIYAEDEHGHVWDGNSPGATKGYKFYDIPYTAFNVCEDGISNTNPLPPRRALTYARVRNTRCCGGSCPSNGTININ